MGRLYIKIAAVYFTIGVLIGLLGINDFILSSVHAHLNLLGWVSMALFGLIYHLYPKAAETNLAITQFWLHNIGVPVYLLALALEALTTEPVYIPFAFAGSIAVALGVILFTINVFQQIGSSSGISDSNASE